MLKIAFIAVICFFTNISQADTIDFSGYTWNVWTVEDKVEGLVAKNKSSVWVDDEGRLHLVADTVKAGCLAVEVSTINLLGDGVYTYDISIPDVVNNWHKNLLLQVSSTDAGLEAENPTQNVEIMLSQMNDALRKEMLSFSYLPKDSDIGQVTRSLALPLAKSYVLKYTRATIGAIPRIRFEAKTPDALVQWSARPMKPNPVAKKMPAFIHLGCFEEGSIGGPVEVIVNSFKFEAFVEPSN